MATDGRTNETDSGNQVEPGGKGMKIRTAALWMVLCVLVTSVAGAETYEWVHKKTKKGVELYYRNVPNSPIKEYKAVCEMEYPIEVLLEVLIDVPNYPAWMPDCRSAQILKEFNKGLERGNYYIHLTMNGMFPAKDRDLVIESIPKTDWGKGISVIRLKKLEDYPFPMRKGVVRIREFVSEFKFEYVARGRTQVTFTTYVDAAGVIPPSMAALQTSRVPYGTLKGLRRMAADPKYQKAAARDYF